MNALFVVDMLARGGTLALLALWSLILLRDYRQALAARLAAAMSAAIVAHVLVTIPAGALPFAANRLLDAVSICVPPLFWLFTRAWFDDETRIGWRGWASLPLTVALLVLTMLTWRDGGPAYWMAAAALRLAMFGYALAGLWVAWKGREGDLIEERRKLRWRLVWGAGLFVLLTNGVEVLVGFGVLGGAWRSLVEIGVTFLTFGFCAVMFAMRVPDLLGAPRRESRAPEPRTPADEDLAARLARTMADEYLYRDESMTIAALAARLGEQEYRLRRLINRSLGYRNFSQFLNSYRLAEVKAALADPAQREVPILTIALDAGFGSLGPFNRAFREAEGKTPSEFRAGRMADFEIG